MSYILRTPARGRLLSRDAIRVLYPHLVLASSGVLRRVTCGYNHRVLAEFNKAREMVKDYRVASAFHVRAVDLCELTGGPTTGYLLSSAKIMPGTVECRTAHASGSYIDIPSWERGMPIRSSGATVESLISVKTKKSSGWLSTSKNSRSPSLAMTKRPARHRSRMVMNCRPSF